MNKCLSLCRCSKHSPSKKAPGSFSASDRAKRRRPRTKSESEALRRETASVLHKAMAVLQMASVAQFGCGAKERFSSNTLKQTNKGNHYG